MNELLENLIIENVISNNIDLLIQELKSQTLLDHDSITSIIKGNKTLKKLNNKFCIHDKENEFIQFFLEEYEDLIVKNYILYKGDLYYFHEHKNNKELFDLCEKDEKHNYAVNYLEKLKLAHDEQFLLISDRVYYSTLFVIPAKPSLIKTIQFFNFKLYDDLNNFLFYIVNIQPEIRQLKEKIDLQVKNSRTEILNIPINMKNGQVKNFQIPKSLGFSYVCFNFEKDLNKALSLWNPISPKDFKILGDSQFHTDLWIFLDLPFTQQALYDLPSEYAEYFYIIVREIQKIMSDGDIPEFVFLSQKMKGKFKGKIVFEHSPSITDRDILVLPNANAKYLKKALQAGCVIVESGGSMSHIVMVTKSDFLPIILMEEALTKFNYGDSINIDFDNKILI